MLIFVNTQVFGQTNLNRCSTFWSWYTICGKCIRVCFFVFFAVQDQCSQSLNFFWPTFFYFHVLQELSHSKVRVCFTQWNEVNVKKNKQMQKQILEVLMEKGAEQKNADLKMSCTVLEHSEMKRRENRPKHEKNQSWEPLLFGQGDIIAELQRNWRGRDRTPLCKRHATSPHRSSQCWWWCHRGQRRSHLPQLKRDVLIGHERGHKSTAAQMQK